MPIPAPTPPVLKAAPTPPVLKAEPTPHVLKAEPKSPALKADAALPSDLPSAAAASPFLRVSIPLEAKDNGEEAPEARQASLRLPKCLPTLDSIKETSARPAHRVGPTSIESVSDFGDEDEEHVSTTPKPVAVGSQLCSPTGPAATTGSHTAAAPGTDMAGRAASWTARPRSQLALQRPGSSTLLREQSVGPHGPGPSNKKASQSFSTRPAGEPMQSIGMLRQTIICDLVKSGPIAGGSPPSQGLRLPAYSPAQSTRSGGNHSAQHRSSSSANQSTSSVTCH